MRIADEFLQRVVYTYPDEKSAADGEKAGGSGFFVRPSWADKQNSENIFVVTNRHVIEPMKDPALRVNRKSGGVEIIRTNKNRWHNHPNGDDISALPFHAFSEEHDIWYINEQAFLTSSDIESYNIGIGDPVAMIGRLVGHDGKLRNSPTARLGSISMMPGEKILNEFRCEQEPFDS